MPNVPRYVAVALWIALLIPFGGLCLGLKMAPLLCLLGLFALHGVARLARVRWLETVLQVVGLCTVGAAAVATVAYLASTWISPPHTADGHPVMPIGQAFVGLLAAVASGIFLLVQYVRRWRHEPARRTVSLLIHLAGVITLAVAVYRLRLYV